ncbi:Rtf2 RING-finger-domain-containing protein [Corynascus novoguineensis]|uniref:Rtf2 RING-finger-domain-containing protein n=1 Tax=Corynascus novoguineensis TaxID=1126955 RepID=A0AAN7CN99_9PEZI|nr:Rtf2 RING-finger-domain-containing protein [Corynascus novoguineensis]
MGNDGGSIPTRRELVKSAARAPTVSELKATALENLSHAWAHDPLTSELLDMDNVVSDWRGRLYNYESVLRGLMPSGDGNDTQALVDGESPEVTFASTGIKSLRDVVKLKFKRYASPGAQGREVWACPVSLKELGPSTRAVYLVPCGHVFADAAIKQIKEDLCPECSEKFEARDVIPIFPTEKADLDSLAARISNLRTAGLTHSLKKDKSNGKKKRKAEDAKGDTAAKREKLNGSQRENGVAANAASKHDASSRLSSINNAMTASLTARVLAEQEELNKRRKLAAETK